jgi:hypothetical protein
MRYRIHFEQASLPPVRAFWSLTAYDRDGYFIANPVNRYAIGDRDPLKFNPDGSLESISRIKTPNPKRNRTGCLQGMDRSISRFASIGRTKPSSTALGVRPRWNAYRSLDIVGKFGVQ